MNFLQAFHSTTVTQQWELTPIRLAHAGLLTLATYYAVRACTPPSVAPKAERDSNDGLAKFGIVSNTFTTIYNAIAITSSLVQLRWLLSSSSPKSGWSTKLQLIHACGCLLAFLGGFIRMKTYKELGKFFTFDLAIKKDHEIIQTGPYAYVRHPSYAGMVLIEAGTCLASGLASPYLFTLEPKLRSMLVAGRFAISLLYPFAIGTRIRQEEKMLNQHFGEKYRDYSRRVARLIPFVF